MVHFGNPRPYHLEIACKFSGGSGGCFLSPNRQALFMPCCNKMPLSYILYPFVQRSVPNRRNPENDQRRIRSQKTVSASLLYVSDFYLSTTFLNKFYKIKFVIRFLYSRIPKLKPESLGGHTEIEPRTQKHGSKDDPGLLPVLAVCGDNPVYNK